jgi:RNA polymerase sigma-70 factor (ECF subfamily)
MGVRSLKEREAPKGVPLIASMDSTGEVSELLERLQRGDQQALAELFLQCRERLGRMVEFRLDGRLRGRIAASDVLQEAYIDALKRLPHFQADPGMPFYLWLRWVTLQRLVEVHRQHLGARIRDAGREVPIDRGADLAASSTKMAELIGDLTSPSRAAQRAETMGQLQQALDGLEPIDREVLALRHFEELSNHEVAAVLEIQPAAASKRYVRALERLKDALAGLTGFDGGKP